MKQIGILFIILLTSPPLAYGSEKPSSYLRIGVKKVRESAILAEMLAHLARQTGVECVVDPPKQTSQVWSAFQRGNIAAYVDYTGTLKLLFPESDDLEAELKKRKIGMIPLGFQNNSALGMLRRVAEEKNIRRISDLAKSKHESLRFGFDAEFLERADGWSGLKDRYKLPQSVSPVPHDQGYLQLAEGKLHVIDCYTTDGELNRQIPELRLLEDDLEYFPTYDAVILIRLENVPENVLEEWSRLEARISQPEMQRMNAEVSPQKQEHEVAIAFLEHKLNIPPRDSEAESAQKLSLSGDPDEPILIGTKGFTESRILAEMTAHLIRKAGGRGVVIDLGGTEEVWDALKRGEIHIYPEYTGTLREVLLYGVSNLDPVLKKYGIRSSNPLGFRSDYGIGMLQTTAELRNINAISDLLDEDNRDLTLAFTPEFLTRADGWPGLIEQYPFTQKPIALYHEMAYDSLARHEVDVIDVYTTDGEVVRNNIQVLKDDRQYFSAYEAILLYRPGNVPPWFQEKVLDKMEGKIDEQSMREMNYRVNHENITEQKVVAEFLNESMPTGFGQIMCRSLEHLLLVVLSLTGAVILGIPLGFLAMWLGRAGGSMISTLRLIWVMCPLTVLVFVAPFLGLAPNWAIGILSLYAVLPIVIETHAGLTDVPRSELKSVATKQITSRLGLLRFRLQKASPSILTGVKTSAILCVALATLGPFIGAGGYGADLLHGVRSQDIGWVLRGAIPATLLALIILAVIDSLGRGLILKRPASRST